MRKYPAHRLRPGDLIAEPIGPNAGQPLGTVVEILTRWADDLVEVVFDPVDGSPRRTDLVRPTVEVPVLAGAEEATR